jgi:hypothetical protein
MLHGGMVPSTLTQIGILSTSRLTCNGAEAEADTTTAEEDFPLRATAEDP